MSFGKSYFGRLLPETITTSAPLRGKNYVYAIFDEFYDVRGYGSGHIRDMYKFKPNKRRFK